MLLFLVFLLFSFYRQDWIAAKRQTAGTHRRKIRFFAPQWRLVAPIQVKLCRADGHIGPLGCAKFHLNQHIGVGISPRRVRRRRHQVAAASRILSIRSQSYLCN